jgi:replicative DNA helicase
MSPSDLFERYSKQFSSDEECAEWINEFDAEVTQMYIAPREIEAVLQRGYEFVIIDHLHELPYDDRFQLEREVKRLLSMAPAHNVALLALAQLRRPDPQFPREPSMHDWRESGVFEQKASVCLQFYREDESSEEAQIWNTKNRFGQKYPPLDVYLDPQSVTFRRG